MKFRVRLGIGGMFIMAMILAGFVGWSINVYKLTKLDFEAPYKAEIVRGLGAFPIVPMGAIVGFMDIDDTPSIKTIRIVK